MAERAVIERAEGLHPVGRGLDHVARRVDFVVHHDQHALAPRLGAAGDAQRVDQVHAGIGAERAGRALRPDQHDRLRGREGQVQEERRLFQCRGAVRNDKPGDCRVIPHRTVDQPAQFDPVLRADRGRADLAEGHRHRLGDQPGFRELVEQRLAGQLLPEIGIVEHVELPAPSEEIVPPVPITAMRGRGVVMNILPINPLPVGEGTARDCERWVRVFMSRTPSPVRGLAAPATLSRGAGEGL